MRGRNIKMAILLMLLAFLLSLLLTFVSSLLHRQAIDILCQFVHFNAWVHFIFVNLVDSPKEVAWENFMSHSIRNTIRMLACRLLYWWPIKIVAPVCWLQIIGSNNLKSVSFYLISKDNRMKPQSSVALNLTRIVQPMKTAQNLTKNLSTNKSSSGNLTQFFPLIKTLQGNLTLIVQPIATPRNGNTWCTTINRIRYSEQTVPYIKMQSA